MKLTNLEIYQYAQDKYGKANNPHVTKTAFTRFYEESRDQWLGLHDKDFELTEQRRNDLRGFLRIKNITGNIITITDDVLYIKAVWCKFSSCGNVEVPVKPIQWDMHKKSLSDPFNCPYDLEPTYTEYSDDKASYFEIHSTTMPSNGAFLYLKKPNEYKLLTDPSGYTEEDRKQQEQIIDIAVSKIKLKYNQQFGYQATKQSEIPTSE